MRVDRAEIARQRLAGELGHGTGHLDAGRPAADDDEGQQPLALDRVGGRPRPARRPAARARGSASRRRSSSGRARSPPSRRCRNRNAGRRSRAPDSRSRRARSSRTTSRRSRSIAATLPICTAAFVWPAEDRADRPGDVGRRQGRRRHLVEQRLEQVVVAPVDDDHVGRRAGQRPGRGEAAEAGADDDDARARACMCSRHLDLLRPTIGDLQLPPSRLATEVPAADGCDRVRLSPWPSRP